MMRFVSLSWTFDQHSKGEQALPTCCLYGLPLSLIWWTGDGGAFVTWEAQSVHKGKGKIHNSRRSMSCLVACPVHREPRTERPLINAHRSIGVLEY
jgi:hypothetical protein